MATDEQVRQQLIELQSQLAFQEDAIAGLDRALAQQQQEILILRRQLELLHKRQDELATGRDLPPPADEKPPHY